MGKLFGTLSFVVGAAVLGAVVWWIRTSEPAQREEAGRPPYVLPVTLADVKRGDLTPLARMTGTVRSPAQANLAFQTRGVIAMLAVREGDRITAGTDLAQLESREEELLLAAAVAKLGLAERELEKLRAGERVEVTDRIKAERDIMRAEEEIAAVEVARGEKLVPDRVISEAGLDRLMAVHSAAVARSAAVEHRLAEALAGARPEDLAIAEAEVEVERSAVAVAREALDRTVLRSPVAGVVLRRYVAVGDYLPVGQPAFEVVDLTQIEVEVEIPPRFAARITDGAPVLLRVDELEGLELSALLDVQIPVADERSRNFRGLVRLPVDGERGLVLKPGMFVRVDLALATQKNALLVPADAVRITEGGDVVVRASPTTAEDGASALVAEWVSVRVLASEGGTSAIEVLDGTLGAGEQIIVTGVDIAFEGAPLVVRDREAR
jgi:RND family efflux transporter MFP subunit